MIHRILSAAALTGVCTLGAAAPSMAAVTAERAPLGAPHVAVAAKASDSAACTALTTQLVSQLTSIGTSLVGLPPNISAATSLIGEVLGDVSALQSSGCLPANPPTTGAGAPSACVPDVAQLLSDVFALLADLTAATPNVVGAQTALTNALSDVTKLTSGGCLPSVPVPPVPGLPTPMH
jgi:hypothetical protein